MTPLERATHSLRALSLGDAFGERFFDESPHLLVTRELPAGPWHYTDDTHMAISIVRVLREHGRIDQDALAEAFAKEHRNEPWRGYAGGARRLLTAVGMGAPWREEAEALFDGGSYGNGGAMRAAPLGAWFRGEPERAAREAALSAEVTHAHPEGQAGAIAVAVAASIFDAGAEPGEPFLRAVLERTPAGRTQKGLRTALSISASDLDRAIHWLGTGEGAAAFDTVPYCIWMVAHHHHDFEDAMWRTVGGMGDRDTTCAIVAGILGADGRALPEAWLKRTEGLPDDLA